MNDQFLLAPRILNSAISGAIAAVIVYPLDLVKTRFQTQTIGEDGKRAYTSIPKSFAKIYKFEGFLGLYKGLALSIGFLTPELVVNIAGNDFFRHLLHPGNGEITLFRQAFAAALTGLLASVITTPKGFLKIQLQDEGRSLAEAKMHWTVLAVAVTKPNLTARQVIRNVFKTKGILGMYRGFIPCAVREIPFCIIYFPLFAVLYDIGPHREDGEATVSWSFLSGIISGSVSAFLLTPIDVVKTRVQTLHSMGMECEGMINCFRRIYKYEGVASLFRGALCRVMVVAPLFGITEMIYYIGVAEYLLDIPTQTFIR